MGAVFALFAGFYYWAGKIVGKQYNEVLGQIHFWIMFIGVSLKGSNFDKGKRFYRGLSGGGLPNNPDNFVLYYKNVKQDKKKIYNELRGKSGVYLFINNINNKKYNYTNH